MKTRAQMDMQLAAELIAGAVGKPGAKIYGGLCLNFPVMVRTCGLCQAITFSGSKSAGTGERAEAHKLLLAHIARILGTQPEALVATVAEASAGDYLIHTRRVLGAWIYFKRFAVSILKADPAAAEDNISG